VVPAPDPDRAVPAARREPLAVGEEDRGLDRVRVPAQDRGLDDGRPTPGGGPDADRVIGARGAEVEAAGREGDARDVRVEPLQLPRAMTEGHVPDDDLAPDPREAARAVAAQGDAADLPVQGRRVVELEAVVERHLVLGERVLVPELDAVL